MKIKATQLRGALIWSLIFSVTGQIVFHSSAMANPPHNRKSLNPDLIRTCVNQLLYSRIFDNGDPSGDRTIIDPSSAALACRNVQSLKDAKDIKICINGLLYETTFPDGSPSGDRTIFDPHSAALACTPCQD